MKLRIMQDNDPKNPRKAFDHLGKMVCFHRRHNLGDEDHGYDTVDYNGWEKMEAAIKKNEDVVVILPLFLYEHGGVAISTSSLSCIFDSGQIGFVYATRKDVLENYMKKRISKKLRDQVQECLEAEVEEYDRYLQGEVYGYEITDDKGGHIDSCWGFYGREYCEQEANEQLKYWEDQEAQREPSFIPAPVCAVA